MFVKAKKYYTFFLVRTHFVRTHFVRTVRLRLSKN